MANAPVYQRRSEIHTKRQATQHDCLSSLLGDEDKCIEIVYVEEKLILYWATRAAKAGQIFLVLAGQAPRTHQGRTPFISVSTVIRVHPSLVSLVQIE
jgi:hypothetical protein